MKVFILSHFASVKLIEESSKRTNEIDVRGVKRKDREHGKAAKQIHQHGNEIISMTTEINFSEYV